MDAGREKKGVGVKVVGRGEEGEAWVPSLGSLPVRGLYLGVPVMYKSGFDTVSADFERARRGSLPFTVRVRFQPR